MGKYAPLREFLIERDEAVVPMTFDQIEKLLGQPLPASKKSRAWWSNNPDNNVMTREWLAAGFLAETVDVNEQKLVFRKMEEYPIIFPGESEGDFFAEPSSAVALTSLSPAAAAVPTAAESSAAGGVRPELQPLTTRPTSASHSAGGANARNDNTCISSSVKPVLASIESSRSGPAGDPD